MRISQIGVGEPKLQFWGVNFFFVYLWVDLAIALSSRWHTINSDIQWDFSALLGLFALLWWDLLRRKDNRSALLVTCILFACTVSIFRHIR